MLHGDVNADVDTTPLYDPGLERPAAAPSAPVGPGKHAREVSPLRRLYGRARATHSGTSPRAPTATTMYWRPSCR